MIDSFNIISNFNENITSHFQISPAIETRFRLGFDLFTFSSKEYLKNASLAESKMYGILMQDYMKREEIPDRNAFLSLFTPVSSPIKPAVVEVPVEASLNQEETDSSSIQEGSPPESENESDYLPGEDEERIVPEDNLRKKSSDKSFLSLNSVQNKMKNNQGTIAGKVKKSCRIDKRTGRNTRLFEEATKNLTAEKKTRFRKYALTYKKTYRTWSKLMEFLSLNAEFGSLFANMAILLLSDDFKNEYEECINKGKMNANTKAFLREQENKDFYIRKFNAMIDTLKGNAIDFENEIKKHRKALKKD